MNFLSKFNIKTVLIFSCVIYIFIMNSLESYLLTNLFGDTYTNNFITYHKSYELFTWFVPIQIFILYLVKKVQIKKLKTQLVLMSLGLWLFLFGFTFL